MIISNTNKFIFTNVKSHPKNTEKLRLYIGVFWYKKIDFEGTTGDGRKENITYW